MIVVEVRFVNFVYLHVELVVILHEERDVVKTEIVVFVMNLTVVVGQKLENLLFLLSIGFRQHHQILKGADF